MMRKTLNTKRDRAPLWRHLLIGTVSLVVACGLAGAFFSGSEIFLGGSSVEAADGDINIFPQQLVIDEGCDSALSLSAQASLSATAGGSIELDAATDLMATAANGRTASISLTSAVQQQLLTHSRLHIRNFPLGSGVEVDLRLDRFSVFDSRTQIVIKGDTGDEVLPPPEVALYRGTVDGDPNSRVFLGVGDGMVNGFASYAGTPYTMTSGGQSRHASAGSIDCIIGEMSSDPPSPEAGAVCETDWMDVRQIPDLAAAATDVDLAPARRICYMAVVCDHEFYRKMGESVSTTATYVAQLFGVVSTIFERDFDVTLAVSYIEVWTSSLDPFDDCGVKGLEEFRDYGNKHLLDLRWDLAFKASGCAGGGRAFADGICGEGHSRGVNPYSTAGLGGFFPTPIGPHSDNSDIYLVAHEVTHNFFVGHTQCYDPPLDSCRNDQASCYDGDVICRRGTIMSYCFQCGGMANIDLRFHPQIIDIVKSRVAQSCLAATAPGFFAENTGNVTAHIDSVVSTASWLGSSRDAFVISANDTIAIFPTIDWEQIRVHSVTGSLLIYSSDDQLVSPVTVDITATRNRPLSDFTASVTDGCWPLTVTFQDLSANDPTSWLWKFGDQDSSTEQSPIHTYNRKGTFNVTLRAANECGAHTTRRATIHITEPALCCTLSTFVIPKNVVLQTALDLWSCGPDATDTSDGTRFVISGEPAEGAGARIVRGRYLEFFPTSGYFGTTDFAIQSITADDCRCETPIRAIVNDPPEITLLDPPPGIQVVNRPYQFRWRDSDGNDNAEIRLYYSSSSDCSGGTLINEEPVYEDASKDAGSHVWQVYGLPDGYYRLRAVITDPHTQSESCSPGTILLDLTPPTTTSIVTCLGVSEDDWCHGDIEVALAAEDTLTGVEGMFFSLNRGPWRQYTGPLSITNVGETLVEYFSVDSAGNVEQPRTTVAPVQIDRLAPYIQQFDSGNKRFQSGDYTINQPEFSIVLDDDGIGVDPTTITIDFAPGGVDGPIHYTYDDDNVSYSADTRRVSVVPLEPLAPGAQRISVSVSDVLGNSGSASAEFVVESGMAIRDVVNSPNPFQQDTYFTFTLTEEPTEVRIRIFDLSGTLMRDLYTQDVHAGYNEVYWDGLTDTGLTLANGAYLYEITAIGLNGTDKHLEKLAILR